MKNRRLCKCAECNKRYYPRNNLLHYVVTQLHEEDKLLDLDEELLEKKISYLVLNTTERCAKCLKTALKTLF